MADPLPEVPKWAEFVIGWTVERILLDDGMFFLDLSCGTKLRTLRIGFSEMGMWLDAREDSRRG